MTTAHCSLYQRSLDLAAGVPVDCQTYMDLAEKGDMNLAKLQALGKAFRQGWLHNVLARVTPLTARANTDYENMAGLFIATKAEAETLLAKMSADLSRFATMAGVSMASGGSNVVPITLMPHLSLYQNVAEKMAVRFGIAVPSPFASATIDAEAQAAIPFIRAFVRERFAA